MTFHVYIIQCRDKTLYTGITNNLSRRINDHNTGKACRYTKFRYPVKLLHSEEYSTKPEALRREAYIKKLTREKKLQLITRAILPSANSLPSYIRKGKFLVANFMVPFLKQSPTILQWKRYNENRPLFY